MIMNMEIPGGDSPKKRPPGFAQIKTASQVRGGSTAQKLKAQPTIGIHNLLLSNSQEQIHKV